MYKMTEVRLLLLAVIVSTRGALMNDTAESVEDKILAMDGYDDDGGGGSGISELVVSIVIYKFLWENVSLYQLNNLQIF